MTLALILTGLLIVFGGLYFKDAQKSKKAVERSAQKIINAANHEKIKQLEDDIFGVDLEIRGLPGHYWKLTRGTHYFRGDNKRDDPDGFELCLMSETDEVLKEDSVLSIRWQSSDYSYSRTLQNYGSMVKNTVEEMELAIQEKMKRIVKAEIAKREREAGLQNIIDKYNGKAVIQDEVRN